MICLPKGSKMTSKIIPRGVSERPFFMTIRFYAKVCFGTTLQWFGSEKSVQSFIFRVPQAVKRSPKHTLFPCPFFEQLFLDICGKYEKRVPVLLPRLSGIGPFFLFFVIGFQGGAILRQGPKKPPHLMPK